MGGKGGGGSTGWARKESKKIIPPHADSSNFQNMMELFQLSTSWKINFFQKCYHNLLK
jgi:hypothetical protein